MPSIASIATKLMHPFRNKTAKNDSNDHIIEQEIGSILHRVKPFTMTSNERIYALYRAVQYVIKSGISGDFVECGVWKGGSAMTIALSLLDMGVKNRKIYLYDTFEGMTSPSEKDYKISDGTSTNAQSTKDMWDQNRKNDHNAWCFSPLGEVRQNMMSTGYPLENVILVKGKVEETIPGVTPKNIALLRLDTDWYESTKHELLHFFPILAKNGVLIIDDYGYWAGSKKATDEYLSANHIPILLNRIDDTGRIGIKIEA